MKQPAAGEIFRGFVAVVPSENVFLKENQVLSERTLEKIAAPPEVVCSPQPRKLLSLSPRRDSPTKLTTPLHPMAWEWRELDPFTDF